MLHRTVRTTVALPVELLEAVDQAVTDGKAKSRSDLIAQSIRHELAHQARATIDAGFAGMADDKLYQAEARELAEQFASLEWDAFKTGEKSS